MRYVFDGELPRQWDGDGIISNHRDDPVITDLIRMSEIPAVDVGMRSERLKLPQVWYDNDAIGQLAGTYFLDKGFVHYGKSFRQIRRENR